jgi:hypothetical protein
VLTAHRRCLLLLAPHLAVEFVEQVRAFG